MESVKIAKERLRKYPVLLVTCSKTATEYAACVTRDLNVKHNICEKEFLAFKVCVQKAAKNMKTKL